METVEVAQLHHIPYLLVSRDAPLGEGEVGLAHLTGLQFHTQATRHGHIQTELDGRDTTRLMVALSTDVGGDGHSREVVEAHPTG